MRKSNTFIAPTSELAARTRVTGAAAKPQASVLKDQLDDLGQEILESAKRLATDPVLRRKIQKQLV